MRIMLALGLLPAVLLAGCGRNEAAMLNELRTQALAKCNASPQVKQAMPGFDANRFCTCLTDKTFQGRSLDQLAKLGEDSSGAEAQRIGMEAGAQCAAEQLGDQRTAAPAAPAAAPAGAQGLPAPNAAQETGAETVEEVADEAE